MALAWKRGSQETKHPMPVTGPGARTGGMKEGGQGHPESCGGQEVRGAL